MMCICSCQSGWRVCVVGETRRDEVCVVKFKKDVRVW